MNKKEEYSKLVFKLDIDPKEAKEKLVDFIKNKSEELKREKLILGLSGGIDSAVVAKLCKLALGRKKTIALIMPEKDSLKRDKKDALYLADEFKIDREIISLTPLLRTLKVYKLFLLNKIPGLSRMDKALINKFANKIYKFITGHPPFSENLLGNKGKLLHNKFNKTEAYYRIKHRIRMVLLYFHGELQNGLIVGAANKSEHRTGYFVKHGCDDASDIMPIMNLYKTQVIKLAKYLKIPKKILNKKPEGGTISGVSDEQAMGLSYKELDLILVALDKKWTIKKIAKVLNLKEKKIEYVKSLIKHSEHMRQVYTPEKSNKW